MKYKERCIEHVDERVLDILFFWRAGKTIIMSCATWVFTVQCFKSHGTEF